MCGWLFWCEAFNVSQMCAWYAKSHHPCFVALALLLPSIAAGPTMDPKVASELSLRIPHLSLRVREHSARALFYAGMQSGA